MPIKFTSGDLLADEELEAVAHGCNCVGLMGAGIAKSIAERYPKMYEEYRDLCKQKKFNLGDIFVWRSDNGKYVFNLATQSHTGPNAKYTAIQKSIRKMLDYASQHNIINIGVPRIGCGIGGLNWNMVSTILKDCSAEHPKPHLIVYERFFYSAVSKFR